jgi:hypothetical protein
MPDVRKVRRSSLWMIAAALGGGLLLAPFAGLAGYGAAGGPTGTSGAQPPPRSATADVLAPYLWESGLELLHRGYATGVIEQRDLHALGS